MTRAEAIAAAIAAYDVAYDVAYDDAAYDDADAAYQAEMARINKEYPQ